MRWGLTKGNYDKWAQHFGQRLPIQIEVTSSLSQAAYLRDAILFAHRNNLPGKEWYKKVRVSPLNKTTLIIKPMPDYVEELSETSYSNSTVFELVLMAEEETLFEGYRTRIVDSPEAVVDAMEKFGWELIPLFENVVEFKKRRENNGLR